MKRNQYGFGIVETLLILVLIALIALIGFRLWQANQDDFLDTDTNTTTTQPIQDEVPQINDASDLDDATKALEDTDIDGNTEQQLNSELDF